jgi:ABC-type multidrug transport system ATPase subunit
LAAIDEDQEAATPEQKAEDADNTIVKCFQEYATKDILRGISLYFNPGSMIGIMGPSGCGKTTFLDILTGRRTAGTFSVIGNEVGGHYRFMFPLFIRVVFM